MAVAKWHPISLTPHLDYAEKCFRNAHIVQPEHWKDNWMKSMWLHLLWAAEGREIAVAYGVAPVEAPSCCEWREEDPYGEMSGTYASACGELWSFIDGGPTENNVRFCHGCGKPVDVAPPLPDPLAGVDDDAPRADGVQGGEHG
jgi:hypothetical protein